jgi:hypothetical protein
MNKRQKDKESSSSSVEDYIGSESPASDDDVSVLSSSSSVSSCSTDSDDSDVGLTFTSYNMDSRDYHGIVQFLNTTFGRGIESIKGGGGGIVDTGALARIIVDVLGEYVGTTAKDDEDSFPLAFISMIPLVQPDFQVELKEEGISCIKTLHNILREAARKSNTLKKLALERVEEALLNVESTALILFERFINLPPEVGAPLYKQLLDDLPAAAEESRSFEPKNVLLIIPIYRELESQLEAPKNKNKKKKRNEATEEEENLESQPGDFQYYYAEDELLQHITDVHWDFRIKTPHETPDSRRAFGDRGVDPARRVFLLTMEQFRTFVDQCQAFIQ